jgi:hypothetical protein
MEHATSYGALSEKAITGGRAAAAETLSRRLAEIRKNCICARCNLKIPVDTQLVTIGKSWFHRSCARVARAESQSPEALERLQEAKRAIRRARVGR